MNEETIKVKYEANGYTDVMVSLLDGCEGQYVVKAFDCVANEFKSFWVEV